MTRDLTIQIDSTTSPDPWSDLGFADWQENAEQVRRQTLRMMGLTEREIDENCAADPPVCLDEELADYNAMFEIQRLNAKRHRHLMG